MALGTSDWTDYLEPQAKDPIKDHATLLEAIEKYLTIQCDQACLREYGDGIISLPGLNLREIVAVGAVTMAGTDFIPTIQSWGVLAAKQFGHATRWHAFMRTLCADIIYPSDHSVSGCRRVYPEDLKAIAHWFIHQPGSPFGEQEVDKNHELFPIRSGIEKDFPEDESSKELYATLDVKHSVFLATSRRAFFTTNEGSFGLGPAQISPGDRVYALLGAKTPFVLRLADASNTLQTLGVPSSEFPEYPRFKVMGDCFLHSAMDGEAMQIWREASSATTMTPFGLQQWVQQLKQAVRGLEEYRSAQRELEGALSALNGEKPVRQFSEFSWRFRQERARARNSSRGKNAELSLLYHRDKRGREHWMIETYDLVEFKNLEDENEGAMAAVLFQESIIPERNQLQTEVGWLTKDPFLRDQTEKAILKRLHRKFSAKLSTVERRIDRTMTDKRVALVELVQNLVSKRSWVFLV